MGDSEMNNELMHYGVKGMKWGFAKQNINSNYTSGQRDRDKALYGRGGVRRINKRLNEGGSLMGSRSREVSRRNKVSSRNYYFRTGGKIAGAIAGPVAVHKISKYVGTAKGQNAIAKLIGAEGAMQVNNVLNRSDAGAYAKFLLGSAVGGKMLGDAAVAANMTINGYDARKYK